MSHGVGKGVLVETVIETKTETENDYSSNFVDGIGSSNTPIQIETS